MQDNAMNTRRDCMLYALAAAAGLPAWADDAAWPAKPIRLVTGSPGSVSEIRARWLAQRLSQVLGQSVVVEGNSSAGGNVGAEQVARSAPDGYSLLMIHQGTAAINPHVYAKPGYDALRDFAPITRFGHGNLLLTVPTEVPATSVAELIRMGKSKPGALNYGTPGVGTPPHVASAMFVRMTGIDAVHIPYKGGGALMTALLGGQLTWSMDGLTAQLPHLKSGRLRALAVTSARRSSALPEVPTLAEAGVPGYEFQGWTGIAAPAGTPAVVVARLHAEIVRIAETPEARDWFAASGAEPGLLSPEAFAQFIRAEHDKLGRVIREAGIRAE
jgi:tripartite-type tricarboxylate transporter receptor subunit TctC